jgi:hypothetical protein
VNHYRYSFTAECPEDGDSVLYILQIECETKILAEDIRENCKRGSVYHEELADDLATCLPGNQTLTANHRGVEIVTYRSGL